jgi:hypothetical protein
MVGDKGHAWLETSIDRSYATRASEQKGCGEGASKQNPFYSHRRYATTYPEGVKLAFGLGGKDVAFSLIQSVDAGAMFMA